NGFNTIKILFNNAYNYENVAICGTRGWVNEKGEKVDKKVLNREAGRLRLSLQAGQKLPNVEKPSIVFLHYPPVFYVNECPEIIDVLNEFDIKKCYYGHIHGAGHNFAINGDYKGINYRLVSCDYTQFRVVKVL
ncbi:MAG: serine/threonine protein phosphatase, partial [Oscillospiraceae bacterium]